MNQPNKKILFLVGFFGFAFLILGALFNYSLVSIQSSGDTVLKIKSNSADEGSETKNGWKILKTGNYTIQTSGENKETKKEIAVKPFRIQKVLIKLVDQKKVLKVSTDAKPCVIGSEDIIKTGEVYSYDCVTSLSLQKNSYVNHLTSEPVTSIPESEKAYTYKNGLLILGGYSPNSTALSYFDTVTQKSTLLTNWTGKRAISNYRLAVDGDKFYIVDLNENTVESFGSIMEAPTSHKVQFETGTDTEIKVSSNRLYMVNTTGELEGTDEFSGGVLTVYEVGDFKLLETISVGKEYPSIMYFKVINSDTIAFLGLRSNTLEIHTLNDFESPTVLQDVARFSTVNGKIYTSSKDGDIYDYDPVEDVSNLVFRSSRVLISEIESLNGVIYLNGYSRSPTEPSSGMTFILTNDDLGENTRLEDVIPLDEDETGSVISYVDYLTNTLTVSLLISSKVTDKVTGVISMDQNEFNNKKQQSLDIFKEKGMLPAEYTFLFTDI